MRSSILYFLLLSVTAWSKTDFPKGYHTFSHSAKGMQVSLSYSDNLVAFNQSSSTPNFVSTANTSEVEAAQIMHCDDQTESEDKKLEQILEEDIKRDGLILGIMSVLTLLYNTLSNTLIYPAFSLLFFVMTAILIFLIVQLFVKIRKDEISVVKRLTLFIAFYLLIYTDLFLVVYEKRKVLFLFLEFQKDILLIIVATLIGVAVGRLISKKTFEEQDIP